MPASFSLIHRIDEINTSQWNKLAGDHPLMSHEFLLALDQSLCAGPHTGWTPCYLLLHRQGTLAGAMALYLKTHSRGEYVFDAAWAHAFAQHGVPYYPKLLCAVPFTPVPGPRLLAATHADRVLLARQAIEITRENRLSSLHILFPTEPDRLALQEAGFLLRESVQFHWFNRPYTSFDQFLESLSQQKRKKIKQDKKKVAQAGICFHWHQGSGIDEGTLSFFFECYRRTYIEHGNAPYLNYDFFAQLRRAMADNMVIVTAEQNGEPIAAALSIRSNEALYGRYWGTKRFISGLHFEICYTQAIEFCISQGIAVFEGGAQGEHKLSRGMQPVTTYSAHWIDDTRYSDAIAHFLERETRAIENYIDELHKHSPFKEIPHVDPDGTS